MSIPARTKYIALSLLLILATLNFAKTTLSILQSSTRLNSLNQGVITLEQDKADLEEELSYRRTLEFVEKEAREKLSMILPGEDVFVYPDVRANKKVLSSTVTAKSDHSDSNILLWLRLFL